jgi:polyisoprenoid-binding protein YceI
MRRRLAPAALLATATFLGLAGCSENAAKDKPEAVASPAKPVPPLESAPPAPAADGPVAGSESPLDLSTPPGLDAAAKPEAAASTVPGAGEAAPVTESATHEETLPLSNANGSTVKFVGSKIVGGSHDGGFKTFQGTMYLDPEKAEVLRVEADIDMNSTWADDDKLTAHLKTPDFFDVVKYPDAKFVTTEIKAGGKDGASHTLVGNLTLHGVTKSIEFPATLTVTEDQAALTSEFYIKRSDFGITNSPGIIREEVVIKLDVKAPRANAAG